MLNCWEAALGAAVSVPVLLFVAAPYIRCVLPSAAPALRVRSAPQSGARWGAEPARFASQRECVSVCVAGVRAAGIPSYSPRSGRELFRLPQLQRLADGAALPGLAEPWHPPARSPGSVPVPARSRRSGIGRGPRSHQGAVAQPIGQNAPERAVAANGSRGST